MEGIGLNVKRYVGSPWGGGPQPRPERFRAEAAVGRNSPRKQKGPAPNGGRPLQALGGPAYLLED